jgi:hypothetical protein
MSNDKVIYRLASASLAALLFFAGPAGAQDENLSRADIEALLAERDAVIIALQNTVRRLEERLEAVERQNGGASADTGSGELRPEDPSDRTAGASSDNSSAIAVDPDLAQRALERTLVQGGSLLLRQGLWELVPSLSYAVAESDYPESIANPGAIPIFGRRELKSTASTLDLEFRVGLPKGSQLEFGFPYASVSRESALSVAGLTISESEATGRGSGDFRIGFAKTLVREEGWRPDLVGRITYGAGSGTRTDNGVELGGGFEYLDASLSFVKRRDPLALLFSVGYATRKADNGFDPGNSARLSVGAAMAASPETSIYGAIDYSRFDHSKLNGQEIPGSDLDIASLNIGLSTILRGGSLVSVYTQLGVSEDAPDYSVGFSLPTRW